MILYTKPNCEKCDDIKKLLGDNSITFIAKDTKDPVVIQELRPKLAGMPSALLPILEFDDGTLVSNDMGLYKTLRGKGLVRK